MTERICIEPACETRVSKKSISGRCRRCAIAHMHADPAYRAARQAGIDRHYAVPGRREARAKLLHAGRMEKLRTDPAARERLREHGRWLAREVLTPERRARGQTPEARARGVAKYVETVMGWCPLELRPAYHRMVVMQKIPAAEARRIIEAEIPGTAEYARREIASRELAARLRHERAQRDAY